jgi:hypothetical protein
MVRGAGCENGLGKGGLGGCFREVYTLLCVCLKARKKGPRAEQETLPSTASLGAEGPNNRFSLPRSGTGWVAPGSRVLWS